ncbi:restriction endonuclease subunit S [Microbacterium marinum]|uniref:restriction endonuclease subunit S n=1 Tax=Microbacterium marinum TaxID=421115 RepID=UPI00384E8891
MNVAFGELIEFAIGGGWGEEQPSLGMVPVHVIRGADFPAAESRNLASAPLRFEPAQRAVSRFLREGDIVLEISGGTKERPTGRSIYVSPQLLASVPGHVIPASFCRLLRVDRSKAWPAFVYYALRDLYARGGTWEFQNQSTGIANFQFEIFRERWRLDLPPLAEQQAIAEVLGALDDKIAANTALAERLLAYINALFLRRFGERSLDTELGILAEVVDCLHSKKPQRTDEGRPLMQLNNIRDDGLVDRVPEYRVSNFDYAQWSKKFETRPWDLVITNVGRIGAVARVPSGYEVAIGRNMTGIRPRDFTESGSFLAAALHSAAVRGEIERRTDSGSVMNALNVRSIPLLRLQGSTADERRAFHQVAASFFEYADLALTENRSLAATRDALLPQLMSGKMRVRDAHDPAATAGA